MAKILKNQGNSYIPLKQCGCKIIPRYQTIYQEVCEVGLEWSSFKYIQKPSISKLQMLKSRGERFKKESFPGIYPEENANTL